MKPNPFFAWLIGMRRTPQSTAELPDPGNPLDRAKNGIPAPGPNVISFDYTVPYIHQNHINLCGDACAIMMVGFWSLAVNLTTTTAENPRGMLAGSTLEDMRKIFPRGSSFHIERNQEAPWTAAELADKLKNHGPIICSTQSMGGGFGHFQILKGIDNQELIFHDPWHGPNLRHSLDWFNTHLDWSDLERMIFLRPTANQRLA